VALPRDAKRSTAAPSIDHTFRGSAPEREVKMKVRRSTQERLYFCALRKLNALCGASSFRPPQAQSSARSGARDSPRGRAARR
jgi:hypothetical protein